MRRIKHTAWKSNDYHPNYLDWTDNHEQLWTFSRAAVDIWSRP